MLCAVDKKLPSQSLRHVNVAWHADGEGEAMGAGSSRVGHRPPPGTCLHALHPPFREKGQPQECGDSCFVNFLLFLKSLKCISSA